MDVKEQHNNNGEEKSENLTCPALKFTSKCERASAIVHYCCGGTDRSAAALFAVYKFIICFTTDQLVQIFS